MLFNILGGPERPPHRPTKTNQAPKSIVMHWRNLAYSAFPLNSPMTISRVPGESASEKRQVFISRNDISETEETQV